VAKEDLALDFTAVDQMTDPHSAVHMMDTIRANEVIQTLKRQTFTLLDIQEGHCLLDVGCGPGDDVQALAAMVGASGKVVGIDNSETMIAEARKRAQGQNLPVEYRVGDAYHLDFANNTFDGCRSERVFQHVDNPHQVFREMVRVVRPGARLVVLDTDWETFILNTPERTVTRKVLNFFCDSICNGWSGRQLPGLFYEAKLADIQVFAGTVTGNNYRVLFDRMGLPKTAQRAQEAGLISAVEAATWFQSLEEESRAGRFFHAVTMFGVSGRKP
jgi:ubiquinone/menaquinone biosynthesis C-methylase UbiE